MSTRYSNFVEFRCLNDCQQMGCPGHKLRAVHFNTSDILAFEIDGEIDYHNDYNRFEAMMKAFNEERK